MQWKRLRNLLAYENYCLLLAFLFLNNHFPQTTQKIQQQKNHLKTTHFSLPFFSFVQNIKNKQEKTWKKTNEIIVAKMLEINSLKQYDIVHYGSVFKESLFDDTLLMWHKHKQNDNGKSEVKVSPKDEKKIIKKILL